MLYKANNNFINFGAFKKYDDGTPCCVTRPQCESRDDCEKMGEGKIKFLGLFLEKKAKFYFI